MNGRVVERLEMARKEHLDKRSLDGMEIPFFWQHIAAVDDHISIQRVGDTDEPFVFPFRSMQIGDVEQLHLSCSPAVPGGGSIVERPLS